MKSVEMNGGTTIKIYGSITYNTDIKSIVFILCINSTTENFLCCHLYNKIKLSSFTIITKTKINMSERTKKIQTAFRFDESMIRKLKAEAKKQCRSVNSLVELLINKHL